jgi:putative transposase
MTEMPPHRSADDSSVTRFRTLYTARRGVILGATEVSDVPSATADRGADVRIEPFFPISRELRRVDDRRVIRGIVYVIRNGLQKDAPRGYGPHKTLYNHFVRWSRLGVFDRVFKAPVAQAGVPERLMIDSTHLRAHRTTASFAKKRMLHAASDAPAAG